jgi:beta-lactamase class A
MKKPINPKLLKYAKILALLVVGMGLGILVHSYHRECKKEDYKYINQDLACNEKPVVSKRAYAQFKYKINEYIKTSQENGKISEVSIYFRDLKNGPTLGIEEHKKFSPASLLKLPLMLTYINLKEEHDGLFENKLKITKDNSGLPQDIKPKEYAKIGEEYTVEELIDLMIKYSDNQSYYVLLNYLHEISPEEDLLKQTFVDLGIIDPQNFADETLSVKAYGQIFVQLYNSSFFNNKEMSECALEKLSNIEWKDGLNAGLPPDIEVAHKFGERNLDGGKKQLHDCGVVYFPENPYMLCVMTRGDDFGEMSEVISTISKMFYEEFLSRKM